MLRLLLLLAAVCAAPLASAQSTIEATPNPYDGAVHEALVLRNAGAAPVTLDSLRFASSFDDAWFGWALVYTAYIGGEERAGLLVCDPVPRFQCNDQFGLFGSALAPSDSVVFSRIEGYCAFCRGGALDDLLYVYGGGDPVPLEVEINNGGFIVAAEGGAAAAEPRVDVYPNPGGVQRTLRLVLPGPTDVEVRTFDGAGRLVAGPDRHAASGGPLLVPLPLAGLSAGVYYVEVRATARTGGTWESRTPIVVRD